MAQEPSASVDDVELLLRIAVDRDQIALQVFLARHKDRVYGFLSKRFGHHIADEAFYRAMFQVWHFSDRYDPRKGNAGPWVLRIAQNAALSILRGEKRRRRAELAADPAYDPGDCGPDGDEEFAEAQKEKEQVRVKRKRDLHGIIDSLQPLQRAIMLADMADPSGAAPARALADTHGSTVNSILATRSKAKNRIRQEFIRLGHYPDGKGARPDAR